MDVTEDFEGWRTSRRSFANGNCVEVAGWRKARRSMSNGNCAEVGGWRKSSSSEAGNCVEAGDAERVVVRDTMDRDGTVLVFPAAAWASFTARIAGAP